MSLDGRRRLLALASDLDVPVLEDTAYAALRFEGNEIAPYLAKRDAMLAALERHMPAGVTWTRPEGGLFDWATLPVHIDTAALLQRAVSETQVAFVPGHAFFADGTGRNTMRLSYSLPSADKITEGVALLAGLISRA